jgi:hypothetical protein
LVIKLYFDNIILSYRFDQGFYVSKPVKDFLLNIIPTEHGWKILLFQNWENIIGNLKDKVIIDQIKDDILYLGVIHPAWAQELHMLSSMLKAKINSCLDKERIKAIRFKLISPQFKKTRDKNNMDKNNGVKSHLSDTVCKKLSKTEQLVLDNVTDTELRNIMYEFGVRCKGTRGDKR